MWMECERALAHLVNMKRHVSQSAVLSATLGQRAEGRAPVDLLVEATRLKFSESEIAELRRLYADDVSLNQAKTPQKAA